MPEIAPEFPSSAHMSSGGGFGLVMKPRKKSTASKKKKATSKKTCVKYAKKTTASKKKKTLSKKKKTSSSSTASSGKSEWRRTAQKVMYKGELLKKWTNRTTGESAVRRARVSPDGKRKFVFRRI